MKEKVLYRKNLNNFDTPADILNKIAEYYNISIAELSGESGYDRPQAFYDVINGKTQKISHKMAERIMTAFPEINKIWLLTGEGAMLKDNTAGRDIITRGTNITGDNTGTQTINIDNSGCQELSDSQKKNIKLLENEVERLVDKDRVEAREVINYEKGKPYYNIDFINGFSSVEEISHYQPEYNIYYPPANDCQCWVNATGDSMKGVIDSGDKIAIKQIDKEWFPLGEVYAIITTNGHRMIKKITRSEDKDCYKLVSANPDKDKYPDQDIPKKMIQTLFKVVIAIKFIN